WLASFASPDVGLITNVGPAHLERVETVENVARAKAELVEALPPGGVAVVPEEPLLDPYLVRTDIEIRRFGRVEEPGVFRLRERTDCSTAIPLPIRAALGHLAERGRGRRRLAVLGEMAELGEAGPAYHREVGAAAAAAGVEALIGVGPLAAEYAVAANGVD